MRWLSSIRFWIAAVLAFAVAAPSFAAPVVLPGNNVVETVDFERHVMGVFGRMGCNLGSCHGSFQGRGGFRLSLFGFDPDKDILAVTKDSLGRRINVNDPDNSLLLLKAIGAMEHAGGMRFAKGSWPYQILREWIARGAPWQMGSGDVTRIKITPEEIAFKPGEKQAQLQVTALFTDGQELDITPLCDFKANDDSVAEVSNLGLVKTVRAGATAIVVNYRRNVLPVRVMVPTVLPEGKTYPQIAAKNYVDTHVLERLRKLNMIPSEVADDLEFLRRVTIDTIGQLPTPKEVKEFLADTNPNKRAKKIDDLLVHPLHAAVWATKFCDITGNDTLALENPVPLKAKRSQMWHDWFRKRVQENVPYDQIVKGVLVATSREGREPSDWLAETKKLDEAMVKGFDNDYSKRETLDLYWRRQQQIPIEQWGEKTAAAFLGVRIECAQCHKHPFDRWTQVEYRSFANIFGQVVFGSSPETKKLIDAENSQRKQANVKNNNQLNLVKEVFLGPTAKNLTHPDTNLLLPAQALGGPVIKHTKGHDMRADLFDWMRSPDNPFFARSFVNRVWGHYFGLGIVHPVDDFALGNPPSNDKLLDSLAKDFIDSKFDIRHIERVILNSRIYQQTSRVNETNKFDKNNFSHAYIRPMMAEQVVDVLNCALGSLETFGNDVRAGSKAVEVGPSQLQNPTLAYAFRIFGRPPRTAACDCERAMEPALPQKLFLMTDANLLRKINDPQGRLAQVVKNNKSDVEAFEELFLATLTRLPNESERQAFEKHRRIADNRRELFFDTLWALINTREFILNH